MKILRSFSDYLSTGKPLALVLSVTLSVLFVTGLVQAASTISTNISTDGTLSVTGASTLTGAVSAIGNLISGRATTTVFSVNNTAYFGGTATTTIGPAGNITVPSGGTVTVTTANTATSTLSVGCLQMYATSTATAVHLEFNHTIATTTINGVSAGVVAWKYGACPV